MRPPREAPYPSESKLSEACIKRIHVEWLGEVMKVHGSAMQTSGNPDLIGCVPVARLGGRMFAIELKQPGKKPTPLQYKRLRDWEAAGALAGWATTEVELDELLAHAADPAWANPQLTRQESHLAARAALPSRPAAIRSA